MNPQAINDAISILKLKGQTINSIPQAIFGEEKVINAARYLEKQLTAYFAEDSVEKFKEEAA